MARAQLRCSFCGKSQVPMIGSDMSGALICGRCIHEGVSIINPAEVPADADFDCR